MKNATDVSIVLFDATETRLSIR